MAEAKTGVCHQRNDRRSAQNSVNGAPPIKVSKRKKTNSFPKGQQQTQQGKPQDRKSRNALPESIPPDPVESLARQHGYGKRNGPKQQVGENSKHGDQ